MLRPNRHGMGWRFWFVAAACGGLLFTSVQGQAPSTKKAQPTPQSTIQSPARRFDSAQPFLVYQLVDDKPLARLLGATPRFKGQERQPVFIPANSNWYIAPMAGMGFGAMGFGGGVGFGGFGGGGFGGGAAGFGGGAIGFAGVGGANVGFQGGIPGGGAFGGFGGFQPNVAPPGKETPNKPEAGPLPKETSNPAQQPPLNPQQPPQGFGGAVGFGGANIGVVPGQGNGIFGGAGFGGLQIGGQPFKALPFSPESLQTLIAVLKKQNVPGLAIENQQFSDDDLLKVVAQTKLRTLILRRTSVTDDGLKHLERLPTLRHLVLDGDDFTAAAVANLKGLPIQTLELAGEKFDNDCLPHLARLEKLEALALRWTKVDDKGVQQLAELDNVKTGLVSLGLLGVDLSDDCLSALVSLQALTKLRLYLTRITDEGVKSIATLNKLQALTIDCCSDGQAIVFAAPPGPGNAAGLSAGMIVGSSRIHGFLGNANGLALMLSGGQQLQVPTGKVTDASLRELQKLKNLRDLELGNWNLKDDNLTPLKELGKLTSLKLASPHLTNKALLTVKTLKNLEHLDLRCSRITGSGVMSLRALPNLKTLHISMLASDQELAAYRNGLKDVRVSRGNPMEDMFRLLAMGALPGRANGK